MKTWSLALMFVASIAGCAIDASAPPTITTSADDARESESTDSGEPTGATNAAGDLRTLKPTLDSLCPAGGSGSPACGPGPQPWHGVDSPLTSP
ncbi:MAG: hypothetical protein K0S65_4414 [Labilithrix sp.]|nr:hypothetical protein [Labilithrix sp.]